MPKMRILLQNVFQNRYHWKKISAIALVVFFLMTVALSKSPESFAEELPFSPGEKLTLKVKWGFITAGEAILEVLPTEVIGGVQAHHFALTLRTSPFVDLFYKVRDRIDSFTDMGMSHSLLYKKKKQGDSKKDIVVNFDWGKKDVQYSNFGEKRTPIPLLPRSLDPLSVFYAFRAMNFEKGNEIKRAVTDGKRCIVGRLNIVKKEQIRFGSKVFDTYMVEPDLEQVDGIFEKKEEVSLKIWVTADSFHIPLRIKSSVFVGNFVADLVSATGLKAAYD